MRAELGDRGRTWCPLQGQSHPDPSTGFPSSAGAAGLGVLHPPPNIILDRGGTSLTRGSHPPLPAAFHRAGFGISTWKHPPCPGNILLALVISSLPWKNLPCGSKGAHHTPELLFLSPIPCLMAHCLYSCTRSKFFIIGERSDMYKQLE